MALQREGQLFRIIDNGLARGCLSAVIERHLFSQFAEIEFSSLTWKQISEYASSWKHVGHSSSSCRLQVEGLTRGAHK